MTRGHGVPARNPSSGDEGARRMGRLVGGRNGAAAPRIFLFGAFFISIKLLDSVKATVKVQIMFYFQNLKLIQGMIQGR